MSNIDVVVIGRGTAWVDNPSPVNGDIITLYAYADLDATLIDIIMWDSQGHSIAIGLAPVQQFQYDGSWGDCTIKVVFSHDIITINTSAGGYAYVNNINPNDGDTVNLYCTPVRKYELVDVTGLDENGNNIGLATSESQSFVYDATWGDITIDVTFDLKWIFKNLWLLAKASQNWRLK